MANFVDLHAITAETDAIEALDLQGDNEGRPRLEKRTNFELVAEMGGLGGNLLNTAEIMHSEAFSCEKKDVGGELDETKGPQVPQDMPNVANFELFETGAHIVSILATHEIAAVSDPEISQIAFRGHYAIGEHTLDPTKHAATHSNPNPHNFRFEKFTAKRDESVRRLPPLG